eukprot:jgi/Botrbrau1/5472/Bobra.27_1s0022.1
MTAFQATSAFRQETPASPMWKARCRILSLLFQNTRGSLKTCDRRISTAALVRRSSLHGSYSREVRHSFRSRPLACFIHHEAGKWRDSGV